MRAVLPVFILTVQVACSAPPERAAKGAAPAPSQTGLSRITGRAARGALVTLEPMDRAAPMPEGSAIMDQFSKAFVPETLFVRVGQPVTFKNSEDQLHNITVVRSRTGRSVVNISQNQGDVHSHTFDQPGEYDVSCDVHPGMRATIVATTTPYAAYADTTGTFVFSNVPLGQYKLKVSADGRESERVIEISGATTQIEPQG